MAATLVLFGLNLYSTISLGNGVSFDFALYSKIVEHMKATGAITTPHFIYPLLVLAASDIFPGHSYTALGACVVLIFQLLLAHILWQFWKQVLQNRSSDSAAFALALAAMIITPVNLITLFFKHSGYFGYIGITVYHNPPVLICRPLALLNFILFAKAIADRKISTRQTILCFMTIALATLMKPNYALIMVPTAGVLAIAAIFRKDFRLLRFISISTLLPGFLILAGQFLFTYISPNSDMGRSRILFAPFLVYSETARFLIPKFFLSILFPLCVLIAFGKQAMQDRYYTIGLLLFIFGATQSYFLAEDGTRMYFGNFFWSGQLGLFIWFVVSMRFVLQRLIGDSSQARRSPKFIILYLAFSLHVVSGLVWYFLQTATSGGYW